MNNILINSRISNAYEKMNLKRILNETYDTDNYDEIFIGRTDDYYSEEDDDSVFSKPLWTWSEQHDDEDFAKEGPIFRLTDDGKRDFLEWLDAEQVGGDLCYGRLTDYPKKHLSSEREWEYLTDTKNGMSEIVDFSKHEDISEKTWEEDEYTSAGGDGDDFDIPTAKHYKVIFKKWYFPEYMIKDNPTLHEGDYELVAWFPDEGLCFSDGEGHGKCDYDIMNKMETATEDEYRELLDLMRRNVYRPSDGDFLHVVDDTGVEVNEQTDNMILDVRNSDFADYTLPDFGHITGKYDTPYTTGFDFWYSIRKGLNNNGVRDYEQQTKFINDNRAVLEEIYEESSKFIEEYEDKLILVEDEFDKKRNELVYRIENMIHERIN